MIASGSSRKPRGGDGPRLAKLSPIRRAQLKKWLVKENLTYAQARDRLREKWGVITNTHAMCRFWQRHCSPLPRVAAPAREIVFLAKLSILHNGKIRLSDLKAGAS
jgi:hypothetical protein